MVADDIKSVYSRTKWALVLRGIFGIVLGVFIVARPIDSVAAFAIVIAFWALLDGITNIVRAFSIRDIVQHWWVLLIAGLVSVAFGIAALYYYPGLSLTFAVVWTALWLITAGVLAIYVAVQERKFGVTWGWTMAFGVIAVAGGILAYMYPQVTLAWLLALIATYGIITGIVMLIGAWKLQSFERSVNQAASPARA
jgi:uncharacterized membrane protein HdeD (DUF308 family)